MTWKNPHIDEMNKVLLLANFLCMVEQPRDPFVLPYQIEQVSTPMKKTLDFGELYYTTSQGP